MLNKVSPLALLNATISRVNPPDKQQITMGILVVVFCALLLFKERWFLENTNKGRRLVVWFGGRTAPTIFKALIACGILFGALLAADVIRPIQW